MIRFKALFIIIPFLVMSCTSHKQGAGVKLRPDQKPGAEILIYKKDGRQIEGELIAVKQNSLLVTERYSGTNMSFDIGEIERITIFKKSKVSSVVVGSLAGGALGALIGHTGHKKGRQWFDTPDLSAVRWGAGGAGVGAIVGYALSADEVITIPEETEYVLKGGKRQSKIDIVLEKLRKKARVRDFQ